MKKSLYFLFGSLSGYLFLPVVPFLWVLYFFISKDKRHNYLWLIYGTFFGYLLRMLFVYTIAPV